MGLIFAIGISVVIWLKWPLDQPDIDFIDSILEMYPDLVGIFSVA